MGLGEHALLLGAGRHRIGADLDVLMGGWMVGAERFELPTLCSQSRCATRLRYAPTFL